MEKSHNELKEMAIFEATYHENAISEICKTLEQCDISSHRLCSLIRGHVSELVEMIIENYPTEDETK